MWSCNLVLKVLQAEQGYKYAKAAPFHCCMDMKQMDRWIKLLLRKRVPLSIQAAPIWLSTAHSLMKKNMNTIFKPHPVFLNMVVVLRAWWTNYFCYCCSTHCIPQDNPLWSTEGHSPTTFFHPSSDKNGYSPPMHHVTTTDHICGGVAGHHPDTLWGSSSLSHKVLEALLAQASTIPLQAVGPDLPLHPCCPMYPSTSRSRDQVSVPCWQGTTGGGLGWFSPLLAWLDACVSSRTSVSQYPASPSQSQPLCCVLWVSDETGHLCFFLPKQPTFSSYFHPTHTAISYYLIHLPFCPSWFQLDPKVTGGRRTEEKRNGMIQQASLPEEIKPKNSDS